MEKANNEDWIQIIFELKNEMSSYKKETNKKIKSLEKKIKIQDKQLKQKKVEIKKLKNKITIMNKEHNRVVNDFKDEVNRLKKENKNLNETIKNKNKKIKEITKKVDSLVKENRKLNNQISKNSSNSSKPPSSDGYHKVIHSLGEKSDLKPGGQPNHKGSNLGEKQVKKIMNATSSNKEVKKEILKVSNKKLDGQTRFIIDTELKVVVKEITLVYDKNAPKLPKKLKNKVTYGTNLKAIVTLLNVEHAIPVKRTTELISELTDGLINLSTGTVSNIVYELKGKVQPMIKKIREFLLRCEVNHKDETMLYCNGKPLWYHVFSNNKATYYYSHEKRGNQADIEKGLLRIFTGVLVHDHMKGLYKFMSDDAECNAHILRYLDPAIKKYKRKWAQEFTDLLLEIKAEIKQEMEAGNNCLTSRSILKYEDRYDKIIKSGYQEFKDDTDKYKDYNGDDMQLLRRLDKYRANHLLFMYDFNVPFDNNLAERDLRMIKAKKKISGGFRSIKGADAYTDIKSCLSTLRKQGKNLFIGIKSSFNDNPCFELKTH